MKPINFDQFLTFLGRALPTTLVVLLVAFLTYSFFRLMGKARLMVKEVRCVSNERQLGSAYLQYSDDFDRCLMPGIANENRGVSWLDYLKPYLLSNIAIDHKRGSDNTIASTIYCLDFDHPSPINANHNIVPISYAINSNLAKHHQKDISDYGSVVVFFETSGSSVNLSDTPGELNVNQEYSPAGNGLDGQLRCTIDRQGHDVDYATGDFARPKIIHSQFDSDTRHNGGSNYVFADGQSSWLLPS